MTTPGSTLEPAATRGADEEPTVSRHLRIVPALFVVLFVAVLALAVSPGLRHLVAQSFLRQDERYVELYFSDEVAARTCPAAGGELQLTVALRSHLADATDVAWRATASGTPASATRPTTVRGSVASRPDAESTFAVRLREPRGPYTVAITLPGRAEHLTLHC